MKAVRTGAKKARCSIEAGIAEAEETLATKQEIEILRSYNRPVRLTFPK